MEVLYHHWHSRLRLGCVSVSCKTCGLTGILALVLYCDVRHLLYVLVVSTSVPACAAAIVAAAAVGVQCRAAECATVWACPGPCRLPAVGLPGALSVQVRADQTGAFSFVLVI
jgi:hypothetical protein